MNGGRANSVLAKSLLELLITAVLLCAADAARAQGGEWSARGLAPRGGHAMAFDSARGVTVLFGGFTGGESGETWEWDGATWMERTTGGPSPRSGHAMVYDTARH